MKKIYALLLMLTSAFSFGQATDLYFGMYSEGSSNNKFLQIYNGTNAAVDLSNYSVELYANGAVTATNTHTFTAGTMLAAGDVYVLYNTSSNATIIAAGDASSSTCNFNGDDAIALKKLGVVIDVIGSIGTDPGTAWAVGSTADGTLNHTIVRKSNVCSPNPVNLSSFGTDDATSEWTVYGIDAEWGQIGSHIGCSTAPSLIITAPVNMAFLSPETTSVNVVFNINNFNVANGTGDGHIHYTINGGGIVMKYDTTPINIPTTPGTTYVVYMELVDNAHNPIAPAVNATVTFEVASYINANTIADVRAAGINAYVNFTGQAVVTYARTTRNQKYIQDATGAILIDDNTSIITTPFVIGDGISNVRGLLSNFSGTMQLLPNQDATKPSTGNTITPQVVTAADIVANLESYESELVQINNATFTTADGTLAFATSQNYNLNDTTGDIVFRTLFSEANYIGTTVPSGAANRVVLVADFNGTAQVVSRSTTDVTLSTVGFDAISGLKVYPNPVKDGNIFISSDSNTEKSIVVYDIVGKQVLTSNIANGVVNVSSLNTGVYFVKITEEGKTATRKLVVK